MFPLESALLPGDELPLQIFEPRYGELVRDCMAATEQVFGVVLISAGREVGGGDARCSVGALAHIDQCRPHGPGRYRLTCSVTEQTFNGTLRLRVRFENQGPSAIELPPGPQLIVYADAAATQRLDDAARQAGDAPSSWPPPSSAMEGREGPWW